jgi:hypothetical protein
MVGAQNRHSLYGEHIAQQVAVPIDIFHARGRSGRKSREARHLGFRPYIENGHIKPYLQNSPIIMREYPPNGWL